MAEGKIDNNFSLHGFYSLSSVSPNNVLTLQKPSSFSILIFSRASSGVKGLYVIDWWNGLQPFITDSNVRVVNNGSGSITITNNSGSAIAVCWIY